MTRLVRVLPDVPTFAVDDGFLYSLPDAFEAKVGSVVRVPLSGRVVRGTVLALGDGDAEGLRPVKAVSPSLPLLDEPHLALHRWLAAHYVAPLAAMLRSAAPPNLPRSTRLVPAPVRGAGGRRHVITADHAAAVADALAGREPGSSALVVGPTGLEVAAIAQHLRADGIDCEVVLPGDAAAEVTAAWVVARTTPGTVVVGTPRVVAWPVAALRLAVLVDDARRGHKDRQSPTLHSRTVLVQRGRFEGLSVVATGLVPALEFVATGADVQRRGHGRAWAPVEVVDRRDDPPGTGLLTRRAEEAVAVAVAGGRRVLAFTHRRGYAPAFRCTTCRTVRVCPTCGTRATLTGVCARCGATLAACSHCGRGRFEPMGAGVGAVADRLSRIVGADAVGPPEAARAVTIASERDLPTVGAVDLAVAVDADGLMLGPSYRSGEDALRLLARVAATVGRGSGRRLIVQTSVPDHPVVESLRRGDPKDWVDEELAVRSRMGFPPAGELIVVEVRGGPADPDLGAEGWRGATVLGPVGHEGTQRWLIQGRDLTKARAGLRGVARRLRDRGAEVRIDADPIDL